MAQSQRLLFSGTGTGAGAESLWPPEGIASRARIDIALTGTGTFTFQGRVASAGPLRTLIFKAITDTTEAKVASGTAAGCYEVDTSGLVEVQVNFSANSAGATATGTLVVG